MDVRAPAAASKDRTIQILIWFLFVVATFAVVVRLGMKYAMTRRLAWDDWLMIMAQVGR